MALQTGGDDGWESSGGPISGVNWAQNEESVTSGMWMWSKPFIINMHEDLLPSDKYSEVANDKKVRLKHGDCTYLLNFCIFT